MMAMDKVLYPIFLDTARAKADGYLTGLLFEVREPNPAATEDNPAHGPARSDLTVYVTHVPTNAPIPVAYDSEAGGYAPAAPFEVSAGDMLEVHIPACDGFAPNTVFVQVQLESGE